MEKKNHGVIHEYLLIWAIYFRRTNTEYIIRLLLICIVIIFLFYRKVYICQRPRAKNVLSS